MRVLAQTIRRKQFDAMLANGEKLPARKTLEFLSRLRVLSDDECWLWQHSFAHCGYGKFSIGGKEHRAHRIAFWLEHGRWPTGLICHHCDNPPCCNPAHLFEGSHKDNSTDMARKGRHKVPRGRGTQVANSILNDDLVRVIRARGDAGEPKTEIAKSLGLKWAVVYDAATRRSWRHVS